MRYRSFVVAFLVLCLGVLVAFTAPTANAASKEQMTYDEIVGTGLANKCPEISAFTRGTIPLESGKAYTLTDLCLEPQQYFVKEEPASKRKAAEFVEGKLLTRETTSLEQITGTIAISDNGVVTLIEQEGIDFQPITVQLPGGEQFPFFFTIKNLVANTEPGFNAITSSVDFQGSFKVPSYRGSGFLDPKGRGLATGYDSAVALPAAADEYVGSTVKQTPIGKGEISLQVAKVDGETGEIAGIFESIQPSDTDLGVKEAVDVKIRGIFYGRVTPES